MSTAKLLQTVAHYRLQLAHREDQAVASLERAYQLTLAAIQPTLDKLYREMAAKQQAGEAIPLSWLAQERRLETLKQLITGQINHFGALTKMTVGQLQQQGVQLGLASAKAQLTATVPPGVHFAFGVPHPAAIANLVGATQAGSPLSNLFDGFGSEAAQGASAALITGISLGQGPRQVAAQVSQALGISRNRALTIARSSMNDAYRQAAIETYRANDDVCDGMVRVASLSARTCAACIALNGTVYRLDEDPGFHPNDRCALVPKTKDWADILGPLGIDTSSIPDTRVQIQSGADWFAGQDADTQKTILGSQVAYDLYDSGDASLEDFVGTTDDPTWGASVYQRSAKDVRRLVGAR